MRRGWAAAWCWLRGTAAGAGVASRWLGGSLGAVVVSHGGGGALLQLCGTGEHGLRQHTAMHSRKKPLRLVCRYAKKIEGLEIADFQSLNATKPQLSLQASVKSAARCSL